MRIVAGKHKGRPLKAPTGHDVRPTSDRTRESVFNILAHGIEDFDFDGIAALDVFAGTGALGLEALSRGAAFVTFIEQSASIARFIKENAATLGEWKNVCVLSLDASRLPPPPRIARTPCPLAFLDAPYNQDLTTPALLAMSRKGWLTEGAVCVAEVAANEPLDCPPGFTLFDERVYGAARVVFLRHTA